MPDPLLPLLLVLVGGIAALDGTAAGQLMISRPFVAGTLAGALLGDAQHGLFLGCALELFFLAVLPLGGTPFPEGGPAAVVGAGAAIPIGGSVGILTGVTLALLWSGLGGATITILRRWHRSLALEAEKKGDRRTVARVLRRSLGADFLRGAALTASGLLVAGPLVTMVSGGGWGDAIHSAGEAGFGPRGITAETLLLLGAALPLGILLRSFGGRSLLLLGGLVIGLLLSGGAR